MLKLYKNKTPNANGKHYYFSDFNNYLTALGQPFMEFELHNYEINSDTIVVQMNEEDAIDITYLIDVRTNYKRCYSVDFMNYQNGMAIFNCNVDYWASYLADANIHNIRVTRCNRNVGIGVYDAIAVTKDKGIKERIGESYDNGTIIFTANMVISSGNVNEPAVTMVKTYAVRLMDINITQQITSINTFLKLVDLVGGTYEIAGTGGIGTLKATILNAYAGDDKVIAVGSKSTTQLPTFKSKTRWDTNTISFQPTFEILPHEVEYDRNITINPNNEYYVGTKHYGLKITRTTEPTIKIVYQFLYKNDGLQVLVKQGTDTLDITNAFSFGLSTSDGVMTTQEKIAKAIGVVGSFAGGVNAIGKGEVVSGVLNVTSAINSIVPRSNGGYIGGGDGISEHSIIDNNTFYHDNWEYLVKYESCDDENAQARLYGATFNQQINSLNELPNYSLLGTGTLTDTYVKCNAFVDNVPTVAQNEILTKLNNGVYLEFV